MAVVTISRGSFSGGKLIAEKLAARLGYRCLDRDVIVERAAARGVSQHELLDALERPPSLLDRFGQRKYVYLSLIQAALAEEVRTGRVVYHGHAGHLLLKGARPVVRLRIIAPLDLRIRMCRERLKMNAEEAIRYIQKIDEDRRKWTQFLYGVNWEDPSLYDLVLNLENVDIDDASTVLATFITQQKCFAFGPNCQRAMNELALASRVKADLAVHGPTADLELEVTAMEDTVRIEGKLTTPNQLREVERVALAVPGVGKLDLEGLG